jgi:PAS domain S-box-containing protein
VPKGPLNHSELEVLLTSKEPGAVLDAILGSTPSGAIIARAPDGRIVRVSDFAAQILGRPRAELEGLTVGEVGDLAHASDPTGRLLEADEFPLARALRDQTVTSWEILVTRADGDTIPLSANAAPIRNSRGDLIGAISSIADMRPFKALELDLRNALVQQEALYRELTHRVKNHLQIISGLLALEARDPSHSAGDLATAMGGRLQSLAAVYDSMTSTTAGADIEARPFMVNVCRPYTSAAVSVKVAADPGDLTLTSEQAGPLGMLLNEATCNSFKHAFPGRRGHIRATLRRVQPGRLRLEVADDGVGWKPGGAGRTSSGLALMGLFARQLHSELELGDAPEGGVLVAVELPESMAEEIATPLARTKYIDPVSGPSRPTRTFD